MKSLPSASFFFLGLLLPKVAVVTCFAQSTSTSSCPSSPLSSQSVSGDNTSSTDNTAIMSTKWFQHEISITAPSRGCHLITSEIQRTISKDITQIKMGMRNIFVQHTSASLTINENADPNVRRDLEAALNKIVPASWNHDGTFKHTMEGDDDMPVSADLGINTTYIYIYIYIYNHWLTNISFFKNISLIQRDM
jgi:secondary thiamine-phosphate synthase enzyme